MLSRASYLSLEFVYSTYAATLHEWSVEVISLFHLYSTSTIEDSADQKHRKKHDTCSGSHNVTSQSVTRNRLDRGKRGRETSV